MAFPVDWGRVCKITIANTSVDGTSHSDFPLLLTVNNLPSEMFDADGSYPALSGGGDIRFSSDSAGATQLPCEVVRFTIDNNPASGTAEIWVKVPTVSGSVDTDLYVWYDKTGESQPAVTDTYGRNAVWADYEAVFHCNDTNFTDVTGNGHNGTVTGSTTTTTSNHPWDGGVWNDFSNDYVTLASSTSMLNNTDMSIQCMFRLDSWDASHRGIVTNDENNVDAGHTRMRYVSGSVVSDMEDGTTDHNYSDTSAALSTNYRWTQTLTTTSAKAYKNGTEVDDSTATDGRMVCTDPYVLGSRLALGTNRHMDGQLGEVRFLTSALSGTWISTEHTSHTAPGTFASAGTPETPSSFSAVPPPLQNLKDQHAVISASKLNGALQ